MRGSGKALQKYVINELLLILTSHVENTIHGDTSQTKQFPWKRGNLCPGAASLTTAFNNVGFLGGQKFRRGDAVSHPATSNKEYLIRNYQELKFEFHSRVSSAFKIISQYLLN